MSSMLARPRNAVMCSAASVQKDKQAVVASDKGVYRRRVIADADNGVVHAAVEDDMHHFEVVIEHNSQHVTAVLGRGARTPWTTCSGAVHQLQQFVGAE